MSDAAARFSGSAIARPDRFKSISNLPLPANCSRHFDADFWAAELQDHAIGRPEELNEFHRMVIPGNKSTTTAYQTLARSP